MTKKSRLKSAWEEGRCPICHDAFRWCSHSRAAAERALQVDDLGGEFVKKSQMDKRFKAMEDKLADLERRVDTQLEEVKDDVSRLIREG